MSTYNMPYAGTTVQVNIDDADGGMVRILLEDKTKPSESKVYVEFEVGDFLVPRAQKVIEIINLKKRYYDANMVQIGSTIKLPNRAYTNTVSTLTGVNSYERFASMNSGDHGLRRFLDYALVNEALQNMKPYLNDKLVNMFDSDDNWIQKSYLDYDYQVSPSTSGNNGAVDIQIHSTFNYKAEMILNMVDANGIHTPLSNWQTTGYSGLAPGLYKMFLRDANQNNFLHYPEWVTISDTE